MAIMQTEMEMISQVIQGDQAAFTSLYHIYVEQCILLCFCVTLKTREDAENVTQEVFVKIWETREELTRKGLSVPTL